MPDVCRLSFDEFVTQSCERKPRGARWRLIARLMGVVSARHHERLLREREQERTGPQRLAEMRAICAAMTPEERREPKLVNYAARQRIAAATGADAFTVSQLIRSYIAYRHAMTLFDASKPGNASES